ncbi:serine protease [Rhizobium sp. 16-449-1b]|uniref:S1 family peptidase n=1 Tax=Rhizobium sp. 16-449-1b TaxID=2819989 RepID=UPI001FFE159F|nr:serine protease [Rhizobium sp. 16-449-1b]
MRNFYRYAGLAVLAFAVLIFGGVAIATPSTPAPIQAALVADASVVYVDTGSGHGSGVHIGDGYILTAGHVADSAKSLQIKTAGGKLRPADVLWINKEYDVALLRTDPKGIGAATLSCRYARVGEDIRAIGNPLSLEFVSSYGRISGDVRKLGPWKSVLVTDLTTVMGQSGGPVFDDGGHWWGLPWV